MSFDLKNAVSYAANRFVTNGITVETLGKAVLKGKNLVFSSQYGPQVTAAWTNLAFKIDGLPNFGRSGGNFGLTKVAGQRRVTGTVNGSGNINVTLEGLVSRLATAKLPSAVDTTQVDAEAEQAAADAAAAQAAAQAAQAAATAALAAAEAAKAKAATAKTQKKSFGSVLGSLFGR